MATRKAAGVTAKAARTLASDQSKDMTFDGSQIRTVPAGTTHVVFKIVDVGPNQSVDLGVVVSEQIEKDAPWIAIVRQEIDNLPNTPESTSLVFPVRPAARYVIAFKGAMHALLKDVDKLSLTLVVTGDGIAAPIEDYGGARAVTGSACIVLGRARLLAAEAA